jgi:hypothetical protein
MAKSSISIGPGPGERPEIPNQFPGKPDPERPGTPPAKGDPAYNPDVTHPPNEPKPPLPQR